MTEVVKFYDITTFDRGWFDKEDAQSFTCNVVTAKGEVYHEDNQFLRMCLMYDEDTERYTTLAVIPKGAIISRFPNEK